MADLLVLPDSVVLPWPHRLTVSVTGAPRMLGIGWTSLLEDWGESLPAAALPAVADYLADLTAWLEVGCDRWSEGRRLLGLAGMVRDYLAEVRTEVLDACDAAEIHPALWHTRTATDVVEEVLAERLARLRALPQCPRLAGLDPSDLDGWDDLVASSVASSFAGTPRSRRADALLGQIAGALLAASESFNTDTALTVVGSGAGSTRLVSRTLVVGGLVGGRIKVVAGEPARRWDAGALYAV